jgi:predicted dehydrogenase
MRLGIAGCGSIGMRHLRNLIDLGAQRIVAYDPDPTRRALAAGLGATPVEHLDDMLDDHPTVVLVCAPPTEHIPIAERAVRSGAHVFIEKPLASDLTAVDAFVQLVESADRRVGVGYNLRFHPGLLFVKQLLDDHLIGRILFLRAEYGQYLPDWRPGRDYRMAYSARAELGGGIILDASHEFDYVRWLAGEVVSVAAAAGVFGDLEITAEDMAAALLRLHSGALAEVHVDALQRSYTRTCTVVGTEGTIECDLRGDVRAYVARDGQWSVHPIKVDLNATYVDELRSFLSCVTEGTGPPCGLQDAIATLRLALAVKEAARTRQEVSLG